MLQKTYITLLFLLVASSAFAQKTERDYLRSGNKLYNDSLFIKAEVDYRKALEINLKSTDAMFNLGNSLLMQQKAKEAMEQFESASCTLETNSLFPRPFPAFSRINPQ